MKIKVVGLERMEGTAKSNNRPYAIGRVHAIAPLDTSRNGEKALSKGFMGTTYEVDVEIVRRVEHLSFPFDAEIVIEDVIRFGKREGKVMDLRPVQLAAVSPAPAVKAA